MNPQQVVDKILAEAKAEAEKIRRQADEQRAAEQARFDGEMAQFREQTQQMATQAAQAEKAQILALARMEAMKDYLGEKARILDEVFARSRQRIGQLPDEEYRRLMARLLLDAVETGDEQVVAGQDDPRIDQALVDEVNSQLKAQGKAGLTLSQEKHPLGAGFLLKRGKIQTNVTTDVLVSQARNDLEIELSGALFQGSDARGAR
ncbi:V-type ATP synthase subunit E [Anaerobaca lacustris]|uniref:V-type ATP synthase subunit E n=1 Tax=Anaerobaca lacustris TaxID=3044600 RepID=A0AAW6U1M4_9BACT|nr:V-type ATP synthase subunit E family protein [Sedimentisphaerales bacterium M17dextr]